jgi:hypothetical protein
MTTIQELLEAVFRVGSAPRLYSEHPRQFSWSIVGWKSASGEKTRRLMWNGCQPGTQSVENWELAVQLSSAREAQKRWRYSWVDSWQLTVDKSSTREPQKRWRYSWVDSWQEFWMGDYDKGIWGREADESALLEAVAMERLLETQQAGKI